MKILFCSNYYPPKFIGGAELIAHYQAKALAAKGHSVKVFAGLVDQDKPDFSLHTDVFEGIEATRICLPYREFTPDSLCLPNQPLEDAFRDLLQSFQPEVVHFHNLSGLSLRLTGLAKAAQIKTVLTLHDHWGFCHRNTLLNPQGGVCNDFFACQACKPYAANRKGDIYPGRLRYDYIHYKLCKLDWLVTPSHYLSQAYVKAGFPSAKFRVVSNGIELEKFTNLPHAEASPFSFTYIGHLGEHKGLNVLLEAAKRLPTNLAWRLNIVGSGPLDGLCRELAGKGKLKGRINFIGRVENSEIQQIYSDTSVFVLPSIWPENQPVSITEAMACGIPVIASNIGGIPELVSHQSTGLLFKPADPADLAAKMLALLKNPRLVSELGQNALKAISANTFARNAENLLEIYSQAPPPALSEPECILAAGQPISPEAFKALEILHKISEIPGLPILFKPWLDAHDAPKPKLCLICGPNKRLEALLVSITRALPLVVSTSDPELAELCRKHSKGLYFDNYSELVGSLHALLNDQPLADELGQDLAKPF